MFVCAAGHTQAGTASVHPDIHSDPTADYRNLGLLQLLKKASRRRGGSTLAASNSAAQHSLSYSQTGQHINPLGRAQSSLHSYAGQYMVSALQQSSCGVVDSALHCNGKLGGLSWFRLIMQIMMSSSSCQELQA